LAKHVLICGGAGFLGSHVARRFVAAGDRVTVVDALVPGTGGSLDNLADIRGAIDVRAVPVDAVDDLPALVASAGVIVDAMAWTRHLAALQDPVQDMRLNLAPHLTLIQALRGQGPRLVIYLGSRSQYGRMPARVVTEDQPMTPQDPQGVHKVAAESHFRNYAGLDGYHVVSLRLPNCFGEGQPVSGEDIGLVGGFIRTLCHGGTVTVYGEGRRRALLYARDAAEIVVRVADRSVTGFVPLNVAGRDVDIRDLATQLRALIGAGDIVDSVMPAEIAAIEPGGGTIDESRLRALVGEPPRSDLSDALRRTVGYFTEHLA
jgi:UDP-glucose 4-epimerase